jgi:hypothetical protein
MMARRGARTGFLCLLVATAVSAGITTLALAKATYESPYGYARTWNAAMRLIRVDNGWKVTEKDEANGYLLFEYRSLENAKAAAGSIELVRGQEPDSVSVVVQLPQMPHYHEQVILDGLASKMRREYGDPPEGHPAPSPDPSPDGGEDE